MLVNMLSYFQTEYPCNVKPIVPNKFHSGLLLLLFFFFSAYCFFLFLCIMPFFSPQNIQIFSWKHFTYLLFSVTSASDVCGFIIIFQGVVHARNLSSLDSEGLTSHHYRGAKLGSATRSELCSFLFIWISDVNWNHEFNWIFSDLTLSVFQW